MTMPHLMNCSHSEEGWCLDCVKEEHDRTEKEIEELEEKLQALVIKELKRRGHLKKDESFSELDLILEKGEWKEKESILEMIGVILVDFFCEWDCSLKEWAEKAQ